jgi:C_GCAxxG_C_C family probable redox protein
MVCVVSGMRICLFSSPLPNRFSMSDVLIHALAEKAEALFLSREMYCAESIMTVLNEGLGGGLDREQARGLAMGFGEGLGRAGCICGALAGAVMATSWFLSRSLSPKAVREASRVLHERFKEDHGSSCCRVLTKPVKAVPAKHFAKCSGLTRYGTELAARLILERLPELASGAQHPHHRRGSRLASLLRRLADKLG